MSIADTRYIIIALRRYNIIAFMHFGIIALPIKIVVETETSMFI